MRKRKAVGEIMAAMVIILVSSLAGVLLFTTSVRGSHEQSAIIRDQYWEEGQSAQEKYEIIYANYDETIDVIEAFIYNYGELDVKIMDIYVDSKPHSHDDVFIMRGEIIKIEIDTKNIVISDGSFKITCISERGVKDESEWSN